MAVLPETRSGSTAIGVVSCVHVPAARVRGQGHLCGAPEPGARQPDFVDSVARSARRDRGTPMRRVSA